MTHFTFVLNIDMYFWKQIHTSPLIDEIGCLFIFPIHKSRMELVDELQNEDA